MRAALTSLVDELLVILAERLPKAVQVDATSFQASLHEYRLKLNAIADAQELRPLIEACIEICQDFLRGVQAQIEGREGQLLGLITMLRGTLDGLTGGSQQFHDHLTESTRRLTEIAKIDDLHQLRAEVLRQVEVIKKHAAERHQEEMRELKRMVTRVQMLEVTLAQARDEASRDPLTGVANRRVFDRSIEQCILQSEVKGGSFVLGMVDIDNFKRINDTHGHQVGDAVIVAVAEYLTRALRASDFVARYGGEEFGILLSEITLDKAKERLMALREASPPSCLVDKNGEQIELSFTFSVGLTEFVRGESADEAVARADEALYEAKRRGKDRIITLRRSPFRQLLKDKPPQHGAA